ncbi:MAG: glycosyltransferase family 39 protein [Bacteroidetes bacterium]|nr:glycosyltransferase family 39 protein [Bacteroidota bacterium]
MFTTYFSAEQILFFVFIALLHFTSIYFFSFKKNIKYAILFLFVGALAARLFLISFEDYFHLWDEQFHALVAKNMMEYPFSPMLYKNFPLKFDHDDWTACHIWLHKQPFFLWQMALSMKILGVTPFAARLPSAIMTSLLVPIIFRMGKLTVNARVGYLAGFLFAVCNYLLDFNTGQYNTDHNDIAFIFYVTLSLWAYTEYSFENKSRYVWLIGFFSGLAILNKWLPGLLVFSGWTVTLFFIQGTTNRKNELKNILKALAACIITFLPWQIYKATRFPVDSAVEYKYYALHFTEPLDGHSGNIWYHFNLAIEQYGQIAAYALPIALFILLRNIKNFTLRVCYLTCVVAVYLFFTISKTKMPAFCLIVSPILFLALGNLLNRIIDYLYRIKLVLIPEKDMSVTSNSNQTINKPKEFEISKSLLPFTEFFLLLSIGIVSFNIEKLQANHTDWIKNDGRAWCNKHIIRATEFGKSIKGKYDEEKTLIVNCKETDNIPIMFFSGYPAYNRIPNSEEYARLKKNGYKILYLDDFSFKPDYLTNDPAILYINYFGKSNSIHLKTINGKYVCVDGGLNHLVVANRENASTWETFSLIQFENNTCAISAYDTHLLSAELGQHNEITAIRTRIADWETFILVKLDSDFVAFKATNGKYISVDEKSSQLFARSDTIGKQEKFEMINK